MEATKGRASAPLLVLYSPWVEARRQATKVPNNPRFQRTTLYSWWEKILFEMRRSTAKEFYLLNVGFDNTAWCLGPTSRFHSTLNLDTFPSSDEFRYIRSISATCVVSSFHIDLGIRDLPSTYRSTLLLLSEQFVLFLFWVDLMKLYDNSLICLLSCCSSSYTNVGSLLTLPLHMLLSPEFA